MKNKKNLACLVAVSDNLAFAAGNIAISLNRYMKMDYDLLVYTSGMGETDKRVLNALPHTKVVEYEFEPDFLNYMMTKLPPNCRFKDERKLMRFCHYEAFKLLDEYRNVVWIDADMSVQADLSGILEYGPFGITLDTPWKVGNQFIAPIEGFDMEKDAYCSGIMMLNEALPYREIYQWLFAKTKVYAPRMKNGDQAIINLMIQQFRLSPVVMPLEEYQCIYTKKEGISARVVHFGTDKKVWNDNNILNCYPEWYRVYKEWVALGGSPCESMEKLDPASIHYCYRILNENNQKLCEETAALKRVISELESRKEAETPPHTVTAPSIVLASRKWKQDSSERLIHIEGKEDEMLERLIHIEEKVDGSIREIDALSSYVQNYRMECATLEKKMDDLRSFLLRIQTKQDMILKNIQAGKQDTTVSRRTP